jgi:uridine kinase
VRPVQHEPAVERPFVLALDGPSGAGKTCLAEQLRAGLDRASVVHLDDFYPGWGGLEAAVPRLVSWVLHPVSVGRPARWRRYDWVADRYAEWHEVPDCDVLVVDGVGSGARACAPYLDALLWVETTEDERYRRAMARDGVGYRPYWRQWAAAERTHHARERTRERADVLLCR